ncbi:hypothetical protein I5535_04005 [Rhodobacteraceae bacterium F11138]|nr:hypothetical protein [Rhodobacteraceae bacterium F11138]
MYPGMKTSIATILGFCAVMAVSAASGQTTLKDVVQVDVLDGGMTPRGTYLSALRLTLADGWKTYWRAPGDAGIPPRFDWRKSRNLKELDYYWPAPHVFDQGDMQSIGYKDQLVLPVEISPSDPGGAIHLRGTVEIGVCSDVCIPTTLSIDHKIDRDAKRNPAIVAALAQRPYDRREGQVRTATCRLSPIEGGMRIEARIAMPSAGGREVAVIEPGNAQIWASQSETSRKGDVLTAASDLIHVKHGSFALDRSAVRITVLGHDHAVEIQGCAPG